MKRRTEYVKSRYVRTVIRRDVYAKLRSVCSGAPLNECIDSILKLVARSLGDVLYNTSRWCRVLVKCIELANACHTTAKAREVWSSAEEMLELCYSS